MNDNGHTRDRNRASDDRLPHVHSGMMGLLAHRWPTALAIAVAALTAFDLRIDAGSLSFLSALVVLMPLVYVGAAVANRRGFAWVVLLVAVTPLVLARVLDLGTNFHLAFLVAALVFLVLGTARGRLRGPTGVPLQAVGMLVFGAAMLAALYAGPLLGAMIVVVGFFGHAAWDAFHFVGNRVVTRPYAEFCGVLDFLVGAAILFVLLTG